VDAHTCATHRSFHLIDLSEAPRLIALAYGPMQHMFFLDCIVMTSKWCIGVIHGERLQVLLRRPQVQRDRLDSRERGSEFWFEGYSDAFSTMEDAMLHRLGMCSTCARCASVVCTVMREAAL